MQDRIYPTTFQPTDATFPKPNFTKMKHPRVCLKYEPIIHAFTKEGDEYAKEKKKKEDEDNRQFVEMMELVFTQIEEQKKEVCIISLSQLNLGEEVKAEDDDHHDHDDHEEEEDPNDWQEELLETVSALPTDRETKQTDQLVRKALQSVDIIKCISKLTPAS